MEAETELKAEDNERAINMCCAVIQTIESSNLQGVYMRSICGTTLNLSTSVPPNLIELTLDCAFH